MTGSPAIVSLEDVHVFYRVYEDASVGLKGLFARGRVQRRYRTVRAVQGVTYDFHSGETVGLIGPNGSGKSTLLAAMTGLLPLESGRVMARSRPTLLGVTAALRPALSGRRNIMIGGLALGFSRAEVSERTGAIIDFSGLSDAIDRPMRTYSSGMRARLGFAIATAWRPEVLLIDEVLAVGDQEFQERSRERIDEIRAESGLVVLVTHNMAEITSTCGRVIWLDKGLIRMQGEPDRVTSAYMSAISTR